MKKLLLLFILISVLTMTYPTVSQAVYASNINQKILVILPNGQYINELQREYGDYADFIIYNKTLQNGNQYIIEQYYHAYAFPYNISYAGSPLLQQIRYSVYNFSSLVYMYGSFTISDFKNVLKLDKYETNAPLYDSNGVYANEIKVGFPQEYEDNSIQNIVSYSIDPKSKLLLASYSDPYAKFGKYYIESICENYIQSLDNLMTLSSVIVQSGFNFRIYLSGSATNYVNMDYVLFKNFDELDPVYNYYAIVANYVLMGSKGEYIFVKHASYPYPTNIELLDYGPGDIAKADSVSVSLGYGSGISGGISYSFEVGGGPKIETSFNPDTDTVDWTVKRYWFFGSYIDEELFKLGTSFASNENQSTTYFKLSYKGCWDTIVPNVVVCTLWKTVLVSYPNS